MSSCFARPRRLRSIALDEADVGQRLGVETRPDRPLDRPASDPFAAAPEKRLGARPVRVVLLLFPIAVAVAGTAYGLATASELRPAAACKAFPIVSPRPQALKQRGPVAFWPLNMTTKAGIEQSSSRRGC